MFNIEARKFDDFNVCNAIIFNISSILGPCHLGVDCILPRRFCPNKICALPIGEPLGGSDGPERGKIGVASRSDGGRGRIFRCFFARSPKGIGS